MRIKKNVKIILLIILPLITIISSSFIVLKTVNPILKLKGEKEILLNLYEKYKDSGAQGSFLGIDITKELKKSSNIDNTKPGEYFVTYEIKDKIIKNKKITRVIKVIDNIPPVLKLIGSDKITIYKNETYNEPGYTATDNYDGDIKDKVIVSDNIDNKKTGTYEVIYKICDTSDNCNELKRTVIIIEKPKSNSYSKSGNGIPVFMYHFFYDKTKGETGKDSNWLEISVFESHIKYLKDNNYYMPTWGEVIDFVYGNKTLPKKSVVITIDDGDDSFFKYAVAILNKYGIKATSFIITSRNNALKISDIKSDIINFESHTHDMHKGGCSGGHGGLFRCISYDKGMQDLKTSINFLGTSNAIAYPYGDLTDSAYKITKDSNFKLAFTTEYGKIYKGMDPLRLPRIRVSSSTSLEAFKNLCP